MLQDIQPNEQKQQHLSCATALENCFSFQMEFCNFSAFAAAEQNEVAQVCQADE